MSQELHELKKDISIIRGTLQELQLEAVRAQGKVEAMKTSIAELDRDLNMLDTSKVSNIAFNPIQKITYGIVGSVLIAFLAALLTLVIPARSNPPPSPYQKSIPEVQINEPIRKEIYRYTNPPSP